MRNPQSTTPAPFSVQCVPPAVNAGVLVYIFLILSTALTTNRGAGRVDRTYLPAIIYHPPAQIRTVPIAVSGLGEYQEYQRRHHRHP